jgi:hypothetical protein
MDDKVTYKAVFFKNALKMKKSIGEIVRHYEAERHIKHIFLFTAGKTHKFRSTV